MASKIGDDVALLPSEKVDLPIRKINSRFDVDLQVSKVSPQRLTRAENAPVTSDAERRSFELASISRQWLPPG